MTRLLYLLAGLILLLEGVPARAQLDRFELGQRLRAFEEAFASQTEAGARQRAVVPLLQATTMFFSFRLGEAGRSLDLARRALLSPEKPTFEQQWADSLYLRPAAQAVDAAATVLAMHLRAFYKVEGKIPPKARWRLSVSSSAGQIWSASENDVSAIPAEVKVPLQGVPAGDHFLRSEILLGDRVLASTTVGLSLVPRLAARLQMLVKAVDQLPKNDTTDVASFRELVETLEYLAQGHVPETNYPALRLVDEAEALLAAIRRGQPFYGQKQPGEFWLRLATERGLVIVRLLAPESVRKGQPLPLVIALHGAGGSENIFFDAYGKGEIVRQCRQRGWLLVTPRSSQFFGFTTPAGALIEAVNRLYPVDRQRVFLVGHSLGAAQAIGAAQETPERFAAVAMLGGSGRLTDKNKIQHVPFFIGVGTHDFAATGARKLEKSLRGLGVRTVEFHEYPDIEHVTVVQHALPEVFRFLDRVAQGKMRKE